ncbi:MAG: hypothetical protein KBF37_04305 [Saprospiraceae bacterium]|jgi:hypothetical protein|nr:hypothetical protein [Saprospiraceae bacterium]MBP9209527.1 hypothetical protein [Saprospiraceae bacterium]MBV6472633.1 hypothetical protein [Saprospiraceae bacterium]
MKKLTIVRLTVSPLAACGAAALLITGLTSCEKDQGPLILEGHGDHGHSCDTVVDPPAGDTLSYNNFIKPMLAKGCVQGCHNPSHPKLDLRPPVSYNQLLTDGYHAPYVDPANPESSLLIRHLRGEELLMPQGGPAWPSEKIDSVLLWIRQGALNN